MTNCVLLNEKDNVVTTITPIGKGESIVVEGPPLVRVPAAQIIPEYHKAAIVAIAKGAYIYKYGEIIGKALCDIAPGAHVHTHNLVSESDYRG